MKTGMMAAGLVVMMAAHAGNAQGKACRGKLVIDSVYQTGLSAGKYDYFVQIRNSTSEALSWQLDFRNMPSGVNVDRAQVSSGSSPLAPNTSQTMRFGRGSNGNINVNSVSVGYDVSGKNITASNCH